MSQPPYLDKEAIVSASDLINSTLISKGYIDKDILFNTIDWDTLGQDQGQSDLVLTDIIYNNDKNIINIIYSLLQSIERNKVQNKSFNKILDQKDVEIKELAQKNEALQKKLDACQNDLHKAEVNYEVLDTKLRQVTGTNKLQAQDLNKLKNWCNEIKTKYQVEIKKKNIQISNFKDQLLEKKNLSSTLSYGIPVSKPSSELNESAHIFDEVNSNLVYNNNPIINNLTDTDTNPLQPVLNKQYEQIVMDLTSLIDNLISENFKFSKFIKLINNYYSNLNIRLSHVRSLKFVDLPNPSDEIDLNTIDVSKDKNELFNEIETFKFITKPLLNNIYKNYHYVSDLIGILNDSSSTRPDNDEVVEELQKKLEVVTTNWKEAISTLENWEKYKQPK